MEEGEEPIAAAVSPEAIDLGKIQRQIVRQDTVLDLGLGPAIASCVFDSSCTSLMPARSGS
jgi:hypothetical protein